MWPPRKFLPQGQAIYRDLQHADPRVRVRALEALGGTQNPGEMAWQALDSALADRDGKVRAQAALCAAELGYIEGVSKLIKLTKEDSIKVRINAVGALGTLGAENGTGALQRAMRDEDSEVRKTAVIALAEVQGKKAAGKLKEALSDQDPEVRWAAAAALGDIESSESADALAGVLDDEDAGCRFEAAYALARLGDKRGIEILMANVGDRKRGYLACKVLGELGDLRAVAPLEGVLNRFWVHPLVKLRAAASLVRLGVHEAKAHVVAKASSRRFYLRQAAQELMNELLEYESKRG